MHPNRAPALGPVEHSRSDSKGLWIAVLGIGMVMGLLIGGRIIGDSAPAAPIAAPQPERTLVVQVNAVISLPTATETPIPTVTPTPRASLATINTCGTATPGAICQKPDAPTAIPTAYPNCATARAGAWCQWPTQVTP